VLLWLPSIIRVQGNADCAAITFTLVNRMLDP
jgi:hypothetical protein